MKLGVSTYAFSWAIGVGGEDPPYPIDAFTLVRRVHELGAHVVQIADNLPLDRMTPDDRSRLRDLADELRVQIEVGARGLTENNVATYLSIAQELRSPILRMVIDMGAYQPDLATIKELLRRLRPRFEDSGITLAIENHDRFRSSEFADLVLSADSRNIGVCLDTVNSFGALEGPEVVVESLGPMTVNLHVKDFTVERVPHQMGFVIEGCQAGAGRLKIAELFSRLRDFGRDPNAILELWVSPEETIASTIEKEDRWRAGSIAYLRKLLAHWPA